jgi:hypothetical protein
MKLSEKRWVKIFYFDNIHIFLITGLMALAMAAAAAIFKASPIKKGYIPTANAFEKAIPVIIEAR